MAPVELIKKTTATIRSISALDDHRDAMIQELEPQAWSIEQPHFKEKVAALKKKISSRLDACVAVRRMGHCTSRTGPPSSDAVHVVKSCTPVPAGYDAAMCTQQPFRSASLQS